jgi:transposase InsO family protein
MPTARFCRLIGVPERTWRRRQARARAAHRSKGPWPRPVRHGRARDAVISHALAHPAWGHRKVWAMARHDGHAVSQATVLRLLRDEGLILPAFQRERRRLAERRKAAFAQEPTGPNQVWQLDFTEFETTAGGTWRLAGCRDYYSKYEHRFHVSPTANQHDAIDAVELALADYEELLGRPMVDDCPVDTETGELLPVVTIVTDNGGPFRSFRFELSQAFRTVPVGFGVRPLLRRGGRPGLGPGCGSRWWSGASSGCRTTRCIARRRTGRGPGSGM